MVIIKEKNFASAIIYVHNAENRIERFLSTVIETFENNFEHSEIICVNDFSNDNSVDIIKQTSDLATTTSVTVVNMSYFHGLELSMNAGMDISIGDFVFEFDNTILDFEPKVIMNIYNRSLEGYDIVSASADKKENFLSELFYRVYARYADSTYRMTTESFRVLSRRVINRIESMNKTIPYRKAVYSNCGLKTDNIRYDSVDGEKVSMDKTEKRYRKKLATESLILFTELGYRFAKGMTYLMMVASLFMIVYSVIVYITSIPVAGWTTTILFLSVVFFGLFGVLTIIIKYLQVLVDLVFKRRQYNFESIEKLTN